jgi:hypothetical protein
MKQKVDKLNEAIRIKAAHLGLIFVNGAGPEAVQADGLQGVNPSISPTGHQERAVYLFAVAESL